MARRSAWRADIWLAFKAPRPEKLDEQGPQLAQVLKFRELQISLRQVHFADLKSAEEWRSELQIWLLKHVIALSGSDIFRANEPQATSSPLALGSTPETSAIAIGESSINPTLPKQLLKLSSSFSELLQRGELGMSRDEDWLLSEFDVARLYLLSATWMARSLRPIFMGVHAVNLI